jgi:hypothetical protein
VKNRFQSLPFKRNLRRYTMDVGGGGDDKVELYKLNAVYP